MRRTLITVGGACSVLAVAAAWLFLAPAQLGGSVSYAVVVGQSMEPKLHRGDLAVVRKRDEYRVADVVAYRDRRIGRVVLHRIIATSGDRLVLRGDNNAFVDAARPRRSDVVGRLWLRVPAVGHILVWAQRPASLAILAVVFVLLVAGGGAGSTLRQRRRRRELPMRPELPSAEPRLALLRPHPFVLPAALVAAAAFAVITVASFAQAPTRTVPQADAYRHFGAFGYEATARRSDVYPSGRVTTGETVFTQLVRDVRLEFAYRFQSQLQHRVAGTIGLDVRVAGTSGWTRRLTLVPPRRFAGDSVTVQGTLRIRPLRRLVATVERLTGVEEREYTVKVIPRVRVRATVAGRPVDASPSPTLDLKLAPLQLSISRDLGPNGELLNPTTTTEAGSIDRVVPAELRTPFGSVGVRRLRRTGVAGFVAALLSAAAAAGLLRRTRRTGEPERIRARYGDLIVPVVPLREERARIVEVATIESLAQLADRYERMILHEHGDGIDSYLIEDDGIVYRYRPSGSPAAGAPAASA